MNDDLTLHIHNDDDITVPGEIFNSTLSLQEIAAAIILMGITDGVKISESRISSDDVQAAMKSLKEKGVVEVKIEEGVLKIHMDFEKVGA